jgi:hypothetical protein
VSTDSTPDLCCTHGAKLDRAVELLEELHAARSRKCAICEERKRLQKEYTEQRRLVAFKRHGPTAPAAEEAEPQESDPKPRRPRWKTAGAVGGMVLAALGLWLWVLFIRWAA